MSTFSPSWIFKGLVPILFSPSPNRNKKGLFLAGLMELTFEGAFVASNAMASSDAKSKTMKLNRLILTKSFPLLVIGISRWACTAALGYHVAVTEYGVHWNFFFSLFVVKVLGNC